MAIDPKKHEMPAQAPEVRAHNFSEVALGYDQKTAVAEACSAAAYSADSIHIVWSLESGVLEETPSLCCGVSLIASLS